jgi:Zn-dependent peptidase ImmA (M78 family)
VSHFYYEEMRALARQVRQEHGLAGPRVLRSDLRRLYRAYGIKIDLWPYKFRALRGAYFDDELGPTVMLARHLPPEPLIFTMAHELKHHLVDRGQPISYCDASNQREPVEIGAEIFAAELIFPEQEFFAQLRQMGIGPRQCSPEVLVRLKHETQTTLSYAGLAKRAEFLGLASPGSLSKVQWKKLEEQLYGEPFYKQFLRARQDSKSNKRYSPR